MLRSGTSERITFCYAKSIDQWAQTVRSTSHESFMNEHFARTLLYLCTRIFIWANASGFYFQQLFHAQRPKQAGDIERKIFLA